MQLLLLPPLPKSLKNPLILLAAQGWEESKQHSKFFHYFAEVQVRRFTVGKDTLANCAELNAGQTPHDPFWSVVYWLYNYGYVSTWFHPIN